MTEGTTAAPLHGKRLIRFQYGKGKEMLAVPFDTNVSCECEGEAFYTCNMWKVRMRKV